MIDAELLGILSCPACQADVVEKEGRIVCTNKKCGRSYPIRDGVPVMVVEEEA
ncbi:MAG: Trm112 family protein [Elusimicrobia bacterium]|nr:Trm112 family protein [Elusimicrobiota bacterium]